MTSDTKNFVKSLSKLSKTRHMFCKPDRSKNCFRQAKRIDISTIDKQIDVSDEYILLYTKRIEELFTKQTIDNLLYDCKNKIIEAIVNPLGLGKLISLYDKLGGNVDTIHNVRQGIYSTETERKKAELYNLARSLPKNTLNGPKPEYISNEDWKIIQDIKYDPQIYHTHPNYRKKNEEDGMDKRNGSLDDSYSDNKFENDDKTDLDHTESAENIHYDPARILAEMDGADLANIEENLNPTSPTVNRAKKQKSVSEFLEYVDKSKEILSTQIRNLENKSPLNENQSEELKRLKRKLDALNSINEDKMREKDKKAREAIDEKLNEKYYTSEKFILNTAKTAAYEGVKMGLQQALGLLLYDLNNALFDEIVDVWKNGLLDENSKDWIEALKNRLEKISSRVIKNWKNVLKAFRDGAISGMLSNIVTVFVNTFLTTAKNIVRIIREGTMVLYRCAKSLLFPDENKTTRESWDEALKILVAGSITVGGIALQEAISQAFIAITFPFKDVIITICVGLATGVSTAIALYALDRLDPFGAKDERRRLAFYNKLHYDEKELMDFQNRMIKEYGI